MIGKTISHYRILDKLGEGGMGVVYKAEDTKLERTVALKFLAAHLLDDDEAKQRFLREAKAAAALHHANICPVFEIDEAEGRTFISMAFVDGETLEDRIAKGPLPIKDALEIGQQIAKGLEGAHEKGIVHRDIKPANVLVAQDGQVTIMDFGLARLTEASRLTKADTTMGTVAYMSPEQAQGGEVDHRADLWALGCVVYEMVAGARPFKGAYDQALLYEIVQQDPEPLTGVRAGVPMELEFIAGKCLAKDAADRYQHASEIAVDLRTLAEKMKSGRSSILRTADMSAGLPATLTAGRTVNPIDALPPDAVMVRRSRQRALQGLVALLALALLGLLFVHFSEAPVERPVRRFSFSPEGYSPRGLALGSAIISPDGRHVVYRVGTRREGGLQLRSLSSEFSRDLEGTTGASGLPFWSPDSLSIGFATYTELKRVSISGGDPITLTTLPTQTGSNTFTGGTWNPDGDRIVFSSGFRLYEIPARGGTPELLFDLQGEARPSAILPSFLPAEKGSTALVFSTFLTDGDLALAVMDLASRGRRELAPGKAATYSQEGYLIHGPADFGEVGLMALPFDLKTLAPTGQSFPISETGRRASVSRDGTLVYSDASSTGPRQIVVRDRGGELLRTVGDPVLDSDALAISPSGRRVAASVGGDIWVYDLDRDLGTRLTTRQGRENRPAWASEDDVSYALGTAGLATRVADGSAEATVVLDAEPGLFFFDWSSDGRYLAYTAIDPAGGEGGIWYRERDADGATSEPISFHRTPANENSPQFSPDGRYLAYRSDESGRPEIYLRPFPSGTGKWQVSTDGGSQPRWSADGTELFYVEDSTLMAVAVSTAGGFSVGPPQLLFESADLRGAGNLVGYDVFPDGQRFVTLAPVDDENSAAPATIRIVENWHEQFRDRDE